MPDVNIFCGNELDPTDQPDAALILGGDGTVHRHLTGLAAKQVPTLVVPLGSANDFAASVGIDTFEKAVAAWRRFCAVGDNQRALDLGTIAAMAEGRDGIKLMRANQRRNRPRPFWVRGLRERLARPQYQLKTIP